MANEEPASEQDEFFTEMIGFLQDPKVEVQRLAAEGLLDQTETLEMIEYCKRKPRPIARALLRLAERAEAASAQSEEGASSKDKASAIEALEAAAAGSAALKALVNLSAVPAVSAELVDMSATRRCCEAMRSGWLEGRSALAHWHAMLLANLSVKEAGQKALCAEEPHLRFLFAAFVSKSRPPPRDGFDDPMLCLGKVINNVCALEEGRKIFAGGEAGAGCMGMLAAELADRQRRPDVISAFRNLCLDTDHHKAIVSTDLLARIARFAYPWKDAAPEKREQLPEPLQAMLETDGATITADVAVRMAAAQSMVGLCRSEEGRAYLRDGGCCEILRAWLGEESDEDTRVALETAQPILDSPEQDKADGGYTAPPVEVAPSA